MVCPLCRANMQTMSSVFSSCVTCSECGYQGDLNDAEVVPFANDSYEYRC